MKYKILTLLLLISSYSFAQNKKVTVKVQGDGNTFDSTQVNEKLAEKLNISDTSDMLAPYAKSSVVSGKVNTSDTASMLSPYARSSVVSSKVNISDTATMLSPYIRALKLKSDSSTLATAINLKAADNTVAHNTGDETWAGVKTFSDRIILPESTYPTKIIDFGGVTGSAWIGLEVATKGFIFVNSSGGKSGFFRSNGSPAFSYNDNGEMGFGNINPTSGYNALFYPLSSLSKVIVARGRSDQSGNLIEWQNSSGTSLGYVDKDGKITAPNIRNLSTGTSAPTTTPLKIGDEFIDTTNKKIYKATGTSSSSDWTLLN